MSNPSLSELDKLADDLLKSCSCTDKNKSLNPDDVAEPSPAPADEPKDEGKAAPAPAEPKADEPKGDESKEPTPPPADEPKEGEGDEDIEKCGNPDGDSLKKGDEPTDPEAPADEGKEDIEKSLMGQFQSQQPVRDGMDASVFLSSVVEILTKSLADVVTEVQASGADHQEATSVLAKSLQATLAVNQALSTEVAQLRAENAELKKSITDGFEQLTKQLGDVMKQPAGVRKSVSNIHVMDKDFGRSVDGTPGANNLSKSQVMSVLNNELYKGNPLVTAQDIISYESGAPLRPEVMAMVTAACR